ncbi:hypothetical protein VTP01DRAFT_3052 [Rhizomucor pusillus]|uniref:uncharacterized protein n=1 Tax=Rhizomucor pusillus TaxID=4840 RepID=UPI0037425238
MVIQIQRNSIISTPTRRYLTVCRLLEPWFQSCRSDCRFLVWFACDDPSLERPRRWLDNKTKSRIDCLQKIVCILKQRSSSDAVFVSPLSNSLDCIACQDMAHSVELTKLADAKETKNPEDLKDFLKIQENVKHIIIDNYAITRRFENWQGMVIDVDHVQRRRWHYGASGIRLFDI